MSKLNQHLVQVEYFYMECLQIYLERLASQDPTHLFLLAVCFNECDCVMRTFARLKTEKKIMNMMIMEYEFIRKKHVLVVRTLSLVLNSSAALPAKVKVLDEEPL